MHCVRRIVEWCLICGAAMTLGSCELVVGPEFRRVRGIIDTGDARTV
jgi:hypothetical protein